MIGAYKKFKAEPISSFYPCLCLFLSLSLFLLCFACKKQEERRFALLSFVLREGPGKTKKAAFVQKGEKLYQVNTDKLKVEGWTKLRLSDGKVGYALEKYLAAEVLVLADPSLELKARPGFTAPPSNSADKLKLASVFFVIRQLETKEDALWFEVKGGYKGNYFKGWLPQQGKYKGDLETVQNAIKLEKAILDKDHEKLDELVGTSHPVGEAAAALLEELAPKEEQEAKEEERQSLELEVEDSQSEAGDLPVSKEAQKD